MEKPVVFKSAGKQIVGILHAPKMRSRERKPGVVFFHGFAMDKSSRLFVRTARALADEGFFVLRFDFAGSGDSEGNFEDITIEGEIADGGEAISFLAHQRGVDPRRIGVVGNSLGGVVAACLAGRDRRVKSVALWSADADLRATTARFLGEEDYARALKEKQIVWREWVAGSAFVSELSLIDPVSEILRSEAPVLILNGERDSVVPPEDGMKYYDALQAKGRRAAHIVIDGANHLFSSPEWVDEVSAITVDWFSKTLS
ncbi:MAG: alpha/beta hydrolase [bacterium]